MKFQSGSREATWAVLGVVAGVNFREFRGVICEAESGIAE
jgi:hypothetical protein